MFANSADSFSWDEMVDYSDSRGWQFGKKIHLPIGQENIFLHVRQKNIKKKHKKVNKN